MSDISAALVSGYGNITTALQSVSSGVESGSESSFADVLSDTLSLFEEAGTESDVSTMNLLTGNTDDLSSAMISTQKAEIALNLTIAIRNKAVDAYKEIMNMQV